LLATPFQVLVYKSRLQDYIDRYWDAAVCFGYCSSLHRKIKALTDLSSLDFIRIIRLKRAAELLQEGELRINEISDRVGFQSPSYFAKIFQKQFGVTPTEFAQQNKQRMAEG